MAPDMDRSGAFAAGTTVLIFEKSGKPRRCLEDIHRKLEDVSYWCWRNRLRLENALPAGTGGQQWKDPALPDDTNAHILLTEHLRNHPELQETAREIMPMWIR